MPAKGSSRRMKLGSVARARAISVRRRSPPLRGVAVALADLVQTEFVEQLLQFVRPFGPVEVGHLEYGGDIVLYGQLTEYGGLLRQVTDAPLGAAVHGQVGDVVVVEVHPPLVGLDETDGHVEGGGLTGAVGAQQADDVTPVDVDTDPLYDRAAAVLFD